MIILRVKLYMFEFWLIYSFNIYLLNLQTWRKSCLINCLEQTIHNFEFDHGDNIVLKVWAKKRELQIQKIQKIYIEINRNKIIFFCNLYVHIHIRMKIYLHLHTFHYSSNDTITTNSLLFLHCFPILEVNLKQQSLLIFIQPFLVFLQKYMIYFLFFQIFYQAIIYNPLIFYTLYMRTDAQTDLKLPSLIIECERHTCQQLFSHFFQNYLIEICLRPC